MQPLDQQIDDDERTMSLVEQALELPAAERRSFLEDACSTDAALLESAWKYVQQAERLGDFLLEPLIALSPVVKKTLHYEIVGVLGEGGQAKVYKAWDKNLKRHVALKFLPPYLRRGGMERERFFREAISISALDNPNIATVHAIEETADGVFIVMPCYEGENLRERIGRGSVAHAEAIGLTTQIARGLAAAHAAGVVHRDLKPSNVILTRQGLVKIIDFGIAKVDGKSGLTEKGMRIGTTSYMSPEQAMGEPIDHRSDLWSLGIVLFEMLTGQPPFPGENSQKIVHGILHDPAPATPGIAPAVQRVIQKLLAKQPADRYQSAKEVIEALEAAQLQPNSPALIPGAGESRGRTWTRRRAWTAIGVAGMLAIGGFGIRQWSARITATPVKQVAVLPFRNIGGDPTQQAFCDGLTETVTTALNKYGGLSVVPATDSRNLSSTDRARRDFGANLVISGTVHRRGDGVRLNISLIDAELNRQIDSETIDWPVSRLYELEDAVLAKLATLLDLVTAQRPANFMASHGSQLPAAHDAYLRGRGLLYRYDRAGNLDLALEQFESAARLDPRFALAYVGLGETQILRFRIRKEPDIILSARLAAERAVQLNSQLGSAHVVLGAALALGHRYEEAVRELETAVKLDRNDPEAYRELGDLYKERERLPQAEQIYQRAVAARPADWNAHNQLGRFYYDQHRYREAERAFRKVIEVTPDNHWGHWNLGLALFGQDRARDAEAALRKSLALRPAAVGFSNLGAMLMMAGRYPEAREVMLKAEQLSAEAPNSFRLWGNLGDSHWLANSGADQARAAWQRAAETAARQVGNPPNSDVLGLLAKYHAKLGNAAEASARIAEALKLSPANGNVHFQAGLVFALLGQNDRALAELNEAASRGYAPAEIRGAPELQPLRGDARFRQLTNRKGTP